MSVAQSRDPITTWSPEARATVAAFSGTIAIRAMSAVDTLVGRTLDATNAKDAAQWANAARNLAIVAGIHTDKAQLLANQPTQRTERIDEADLRSRLTRLLGIEVSSSEADPADAD